MASVLLTSLEHITVTADNIEEIRETIQPRDQRAEIEQGMTITYYKHAEYNAEATHVLIIHETGRAGWCTGGDSSWGEWDEDQGIITPDDPEGSQLNRYAESLDDEE